MKSIEDLIKEMDKLKMSEEQKAYAISKAWYETLSSSSEEIERKVLQEHEFISVCPECPDLDGKRAIRSFEFVKDEKQFNEYLKLFYEECDKQGIAWKWNEPIDFNAHNEMKKCENALIDWFEKSVSKFEKINKLMKLNQEKLSFMKKHWKYRAQLIDLAMKWNSEYEKYSA